VDLRTDRPAATPEALAAQFGFSFQPADGTVDQWGRRSCPLPGLQVCTVFPEGNGASRYGWMALEK